MKQREEDILNVLANRIRLLSIKQVARVWWSDTPWGRSRARKLLCKLADGDLICIRDVLSRPVIELKAPLIVWMQGDGEPTFIELASELHKRAMSSAESMPVVFATPKSIALLGGGRLPSIKLTQTTHDLHVSEVFLHYHGRGRAAHWISEDRLPRDWPIRERPDAVLCNDQGEIVHGVEYGGDYLPERLQELHVGLSRAGLNYEIW